MAVQFPVPMTHQGRGARAQRIPPANPVMLKALQVGERWAEPEPEPEPIRDLRWDPNS